jgi:hypothetical protein
MPPHRNPLLVRASINLIRIFTVAVLFATACSTIARADDYAKLSPFSAVKWTDKGVEVTADGKTGLLVSIDGHTADKIIEFCKSRYGGKWQKRFEEDLVQVLSEMGAPPGKTVRLVLRQLDSNEEITIAGAPMTEANRKRIWNARNANANAPAAPPARLTARAARADIIQLRKLIEERYAYVGLRPYDYAAALDQLSRRIDDNIDLHEFARELRVIVARFGDGHSRVRGWTGFVEPGYLPASLDWVGDRCIAMKPDRSALLVGRSLFLTRIDGQPIREWLAVADDLVAAGAPQFVRRGATEVLHCIRHVRRRAGKPDGDTVTLTFEDRTCGQMYPVTLPITDRPPLLGPRVDDFAYRELDGHIGYIRIPRMDDDPAFIAGLHAAMQSLSDTKGLIIDVRNNGGGSRDALRALLPYFMSPDEPPAVVNAARYRVPTGDKPTIDDLANRFLHPIASPHWTDAERAQLRAFEKNFTPEWTPPGGFDDRFGDGCYMMVRRSDAPTAFHYTRPVVVLQDAGCFSATDIFLGAMAQRDGVTLVGTASGGGSGRAAQYQLKYSRLRIRLSTMVSFRPSGALYDGIGVAPDITVEPTLEDVLGRSDTTLDRANQLIRTGS